MIISFQVPKLEEKQAQVHPRSPREFVSGEGFPYLGRSYRLKLVDGVGRQPPLRLYRSRFELRRDAIPKAKEHFIRWYTVRLRPMLDRQITALADRIGAIPREVHIQDLGYRWASCNKRRHLYFHWRMAMLPHPMIEYLVAHELVHLIERGHTAAFWERLLEGLEDLDIWEADDRLVEVIQVKSYKNLVLSNLSPSEPNSFFHRAIELLRTPRWSPSWVLVAHQCLRLVILLTADRQIRCLAGGIWRSLESGTEHQHPTGGLPTPTPPDIKLVNFGSIGPEMRQAWKGDEPQRTNVAEKLLDNGFEESDRGAR